jgi:hypothetical protein
VIDQAELRASIEANQRDRDAYVVFKARWLLEKGIVEVRKPGEKPKP